MATVSIKQFHARQFGGFSPFGNMTGLAFVLTTNASGAAENSNSTEALADGDSVDMGPLPEGMRLDDASVFVTKAMTASVKGKLGFVYEDGENSSEVPENDAYFASNMALDTTGRIRASGSSLVTLPKPARLVLTISGANNAKVSEVSALVNGELTGPR